MEPQLKPVPIDPSQPSWRQPTPPASGATIVTSDEQKNVLRNTYWLLALSMLPTIAGAWFGTSINFAGLFKTSPIMAPLLMFGAMFGMLFVVSALRNSSWGVLAIFGFTFVSGVMLAPILQFAAQVRNGGQLVAGMTVSARCGAVLRSQPQPVSPGCRDRGVRV